VNPYYNFILLMSCLGVLAFGCAMLALAHK
jgi:hypothetical protein